jgi:hypothetical protein
LARPFGPFRQLDPKARGNERARERSPQLGFSCCYQNPRIRH